MQWRNPPLGIRIFHPEEASYQSVSIWISYQSTSLRLDSLPVLFGTFMRRLIYNIVCAPVDSPAILVHMCSVAGRTVTCDAQDTVFRESFPTRQAQHQPDSTNALCRRQCPCDAHQRNGNSIQIQLRKEASALWHASFPLTRIFKKTPR